MTCDAFAFHNPPTTSTAQNNWFGYMFMFTARQQKGDDTLPQWFSGNTWSTTFPYSAAGPDFRYYWSIDECVVGEVS